MKKLLFLGLLPLLSASCTKDSGSYPPDGPVSYTHLTLPTNSLV